MRADGELDGRGYFRDDAGNFRAEWHAYFYASCLGRVRAIAKEHGYAACLHGSMERDLDLVMVPWTEGATDAETLIDAMRKTFSIFEQQEERREPTLKPHGRRGWVVMLGGHAYMDISVMPRLP